MELESTTIDDIDSITIWNYASAHNLSTRNNGNRTPVSPTPYRHMYDFSSSSIFSIASLSHSHPSFSRSNSLKKPPKQRLSKLFRKSLKHTLQSNKTESNDLDFWVQFHKKLSKIIRSFLDPLSLYDALNDPFIGKRSSKSCFSLIHILCKQFYLYSRSNYWSVSFKIWDSIQYLVDNGANSAIFYSKIDETPLKNYNSIHALYEGLRLMLSNEVITNEQFANYFSRVISAGNDDIHNAFIDYLHTYYKRRYSLTSLSSIESNLSSNSLPELSSAFSSVTTSTTIATSQIAAEFQPTVLTLCIYKRQYDEECEWQNITYWMGDCLYNDYYVNLISPHLAKVFIMMGYDLLSVVFDKMDHLDFHKKQFTDAMICDPTEIQTVLHTKHDADRHKIHYKVMAFLWFIRYGNFKSDLINIIDIGIKQLALNEFTVDEHIIEEILSYSHHFIVANTVQSQNNMDKLNLLYCDEDQWMMTAFEALFQLDNHWIDWIANYVMPQLTKKQIQRIKRNLSVNTSKKEWNKFIRRISLKSINSFCKHDIFGVIDTQKMQDIVKKHYREQDLIPIIMNANYDIQQTFGSSSVLYQIMNDDTMDALQVNAILDAIHLRIDGMNSNKVQTAKRVINALLFSVSEWQNNRPIWRNITAAFDAKHKHFCMALNDWFHELSTEQHHTKLVFFMKHGLINFNYCLNENLIEEGLHSLIDECSFNKKAFCIQMIGDWIYKHFEDERNHTRKKEIAHRSIVAITSNLNNITSSHDIQRDRDNLIIAQYLQQLKSGLSR